MERVTGIGGLFFRARDPAALARWYADHLGIDPVPTDDDQRPWWHQEGPTAFSPFPADSDYLGPPEQTWKLNLRVRDLDATVAQLRAGAPPHPGLTTDHGGSMERVTGIGGLFFRARDPAALARWYADHLGIDPVPTDDDQRPWWQQEGPTAFSPFPADSDYLGPPEQAWKLNLRSATWTP